jgi:ankyrin repeat protein
MQQMAATWAITNSSAGAPMDDNLLEAATCGDATFAKHQALHNPGVLLGTTPQGNTCLHISSMHGHLGFWTYVVVLNQSLLSSVNADGETPLLTATTSGHASLASFLLSRCRDLKLNEDILKQDKQGCNALHHAIRSGHRELALELIAAEPALSRALNKYNESPLFMAVLSYADIFEKLLAIPDSAHAGAYGYNVLHAAVRNGNSGET